MIRSVAILFHERHKHVPMAPYTILWIKEAWERRGLDVQLVFGTRRPIRADVVIPHIDLTVRPDAYERLLARHPGVLNRTVRDISKRRISTHSAAGWDGPVIVKTDRNHFGAGEVVLSKPTFWQRLTRKRPPTRFEYRVFPSLRDVPKPLLDDPALFIDRFVPEREGDHYCIRTCAFLGDRDFTLWRVSTRPLVRTTSLVREEEIPADEGIRALRKELGFDYGRFDYVLHDGEIVLFDANDTPAFATAERGAPLDGQPPILQRMAQVLADGLAA